MNVANMQHISIFYINLQNWLRFLIRKTRYIKFIDEALKSHQIAFQKGFWIEK